jgi:hypothetical protein
MPVFPGLLYTGKVDKPAFGTVVPAIWLPVCLSDGFGWLNADT